MSVIQTSSSLLSKMSWTTKQGGLLFTANLITFKAHKLTRAVDDSSNGGWDAACR